MSITASEQLPLLAAAPNGIKMLRELILELAVRGKLVAQDPGDEPASELLKRIAAEKKLFEAEGKIKRSKAGESISEDEKEYELPTGWVWARIAAIGHDWGQMIPRRRFTYIDVGSVDNSVGQIREPQVLAAGEAPSRARKLVLPGTVVYSTVRPYLLNVAVVEQMYDPEPIASTAFAVVHPHCEMPSRYFFWYLRSPTFIRYVESVQTGIAYPAINDRQFFSGLIPVPPLAEQHRIVAKVDELMALCDRLEAQQADAENAHAQLVATLLDSLTRASDSDDFAASWQRLSAHFDTLFTTESSIDALNQTLLQLAVMGKLVPQDPKDEPVSELVKGICEDSLPIVDTEKPFALPEKWSWFRFDELLDFQGGGQPSKSFFSAVPHPGYVQLIQIRDLGECPQPVYIRREQAAKFCTTSDIMVGRYGASVGKIFWGRDGAYNVALVKMVDKHEMFDRSFLYCLLKSPSGQSLFLGISRSAQDGFNKTDVGNKLVPLCPLAEQRRIVAKVDQLMALCDQLKLRLRQARQFNEELAAVLVQRAVA